LARYIAASAWDSRDAASSSAPPSSHADAGGDANLVAGDRARCLDLRGDPLGKLDLFG
jgi:hypothetical protein